MESFATAQEHDSSTSITSNEEQPTLNSVFHDLAGSNIKSSNEKVENRHFVSTLIVPRLLARVQSCFSLARTGSTFACTLFLTHICILPVTSYLHILSHSSHFNLITLILVERAIFSSVPRSRLCPGHQLLSIIRLKPSICYTNNRCKTLQPSPSTPNKAPMHKSSRNYHHCDKTSRYAYYPAKLHKIHSASTKPTAP